MLDRNEAIETVRRALPGGFDVGEDHMVEKPYGWIFFCRDRGMAGGESEPARAPVSSAALVEKSTGRLIRLSGDYSMETSLKIYEAGCLAHQDWDLVVYAAADFEEAAALVFALGLTYLEPEAEGGTTWRTPRRFTLAQIGERLSALPCRFNIGSLHSRQEQLDRMRAAPGLRFDLEPNAGYRNEALARAEA